MVKHFDYYKDILFCMKEGKPLPIERANLFGGRMSSKTFSSGEFFILACVIAKCYVYAFRYWVDDKKKLFKQFLELIEMYDLTDKVHIHLTDMSITFPNGSVIQIYGLHRQKNDEVKLTGLEGKIGFNYGFAFAEERYEINDKEWSAVLQAIRGFKYFMEVHAANPWIFSNDYVRYCHSVLGFNLTKLMEDGQQFKHVKKDKEIFHYTNYQINNFIQPADRKKLLQAAKHDPHRSDTILYGYPGVPEGSVFKDVLDKMFREQDWDDAEAFIGCVDYGERGDASAAYIIGFSPQNRHAHVEHEYYWENELGLKEFKNTDILAEEIVEHYMDFIDMYGITRPLEIFVDSSAIPFINGLNRIKDQYPDYSDQIHFYQCTKYKVAERTQQIRVMASFGMLTVGEDCPELRREYAEQVYSKKVSEYVDGDDHGTDAVAYGLADRWGDLLDSLEYYKEEDLLKGNYE